MTFLHIAPCFEESLNVTLLVENTVHRPTVFTRLVSQSEMSDGNIGHTRADPEASNRIFEQRKRDKFGPRFLEIFYFQTPSL